jgi:hypothetical protein
MSKLKLNPNPTFTAKVPIPIPGGDPVLVEFTFKHRTRDDFRAWLTSGTDRDDTQTIMEAANAWELEDKFDELNVGRLVQNYIGAPATVVQTYITELAKAREKN